MRFGGSTFIGMLPTLRRIEEMVAILDEPPPGATANSNFVRTAESARTCSFGGLAVQMKFGCAILGVQVEL